jgi:hypothetical protein
MFMSRNSKKKIEIDSTWKEENRFTPLQTSSGNTSNGKKAPNLIDKN